MTNGSDILADPHWFPVKLDASTRTLHFIRTDRTALSAAPFLDQRFDPPGAQRAAVPMAELLSAKPVATQPPNWIFHTAFCCSTLMARALDIPGKSLALKEPGILMDLANTRRMAAQNGFNPQKLQAVTDAIFALLARRFSPGEAIIIKPTNPANPLAAEALARGHKAIFMVSELKDFLISVLKKGEGCKAFMRTLYNIFALDPAPLGQIPQRQALTFTDLQIASLVQRHQMELLSALGAQYSQQVRAFDGNLLPENAEKYLAAAAPHFALDWPGGAAEAQANGDVFKHNSKFSGEEYGASVKASEAADIERAHSEALSVTLNWANSLTLGGAVSMPPGPALA